MRIAPEIAGLDLPLVGVSRTGRSSGRKRNRLDFNELASLVNSSIDPRPDSELMSRSHLPVWNLRQPLENV
jgi:hypothetical protein